MSNQLLDDADVFQSTRPRGARQQPLTLGGRSARFQSTRPRGARLKQEAARLGLDVFQSTRPRGARLRGTGFSRRAYRFQSTRPRGARLVRRSSWIKTKNFNPRARVGRDIDNALRRTDQSYFNPRARVGRDFLRLLLSCHRQISIHAPAWGATIDFHIAMRPCEFQSTRPRGARQAFAGICRRSAAFQSTRPRGARRAGRSAGGQAQTFQSTRPRGARQHFHDFPPFSPLFQSTRPRGARLYHNKKTMSIIIFQSTRPRGARLDALARSFSPSHFNPRARVGRDNSPSAHRRVVPISIHAPAWGATAIQA